MAKEKILIVEDDPDIVEMISYNLKKEGYSAYAVLNGEDALVFSIKEKPELIILDLMLPGIDGLEVCRKLRQGEKTQQIPIIMLTAKSQELDKIVGLELGADDYMTKPFSPRELLARIKAILRRIKICEVAKTIQSNQIVIDTLKHEVLVGGNQVILTPTEFKIIELMVRRPDIVLSRNKILDAVFGYESSSYDRTIDAHIKSLRKKLGKYKDCIETVRGIGYKFKIIE